MSEKTWLKKMIMFGVISFFAIILNLNISRTYEARTDILFLPKNETISYQQDLIVENFKQILMSLAFNDRIAGESDALEVSIELPNYKRKEFWNSKISVAQLEKSNIVSIKNFDKNSILAKELNEDTVESLIVVASNYYNIESDLGIRIVDGPIVKKIVSQNLLSTIGESMLWSLGFYLISFHFLPFAFIKREVKKRKIPGQNFSRPRRESLKKIIPKNFPEEENYFAVKNFFEKTQEAVDTEKALSQKDIFSLPRFPSFGKKSPTPVNLPINEGDVPNIFRQKESLVKSEMAELANNDKSIEAEYVPREATPEEVKARLNSLLGGR